MIKKLLALTAAFLLCLGLVSCADNNPLVPEDMQSATLTGEPFYLFVPQNWTPNLSSGVSSAYISSNEKIMVSARYFTPSDATLTPDAYLTQCAETYAKTLNGFEKVEQAPTVLSKEDAVKLTYKMTADEKSLTCFQIAALYKGDMVTLCGYCVTDLYDTYKEDFDRIVKEFLLCDKPTVQNEAVTDKKTPEGMKIASAEHLEYVFYVPTLWVCTPEDGASEAYYPESAKSNVTVTSYNPEVSISVQDYFAQCEEEYKEKLSGYERLSEQTRTVAERTAYSYTYRTEADGASFRIMQTVFAYNGMLYSITYTALDDHFDLHVGDVEVILNTFRFR